MGAASLSGFRGDLDYDEPLSEHTSWRVGGPAQRFYRPADKEDLASFLGVLPRHEPLFWLGLGSNLLVRDGGLPGTVICALGRLKDMHRLDGLRVRVDAGVPCARVARYSADCGLVGAEFLAGIPGTMGGALAMNAGAFGGETWPLVTEVETVTAGGEFRVRHPAEYAIGYRSVHGAPGEYFVSAVLRLERGDPAASRERIRRLLALRAATQPTNVPNGGSVFRNPDGDHAARLIEAAGLKGYCVGGACVSEKHANFILNTGSASAADIETLIEHVRMQVEMKQGVRLQTEVKIVGEKRDAWRID
jgi:UDP-N-acetylmuramate dehydrogenase